MSNEDTTADERDFIGIFEDGRAVPASRNVLLAWCHDGHGWLDFIRGLFDETYAPTLTLLMPKHGLQKVRIVPAKGFKHGATFNDPFKGRVAPG